MTKEDEVLVTKALLLGYTFSTGTKYITCIAPDNGVGVFDSYREAATAAINHAQVPDETKLR